MRKSVKLRTSILTSLANGEFKVGDQLPPETALIRKYEMSRASVREGLASLVQEGILSRRRGAGTFVARMESQSRLQAVAAIVNSVRGREDSTSQMIRIVEDKLHEAGFSLVLCNHANDAERMKRYVERIAQQGIAGAIFQPLDGPLNSKEQNLAAIRELENHGIPFVLVGTIVSEDTAHRYSIVSSNGYVAVRDMVRHLTRLGHKRIAFIRFPKSPISDDRYAGFVEQMQQQGLPLPEEYVRSLQPVAVEFQGQQEVRDLFSLPEPPTAVICVHDLIARNVIQEVRRLGRKVPEDLAVVGFGDMPFAAYIDPPLTTIRVPMDEEGAGNVRMLLDKIASRFAGERQVFLPCELVIRESCGAPEELRSKISTQYSTVAAVP